MTTLDIQSLKTWTVLSAVLAALTGGAWTIQSFAIERMLFQDAVATGYMWSNYLARSVPDLEQIATGGKPSATSYSFFEKAQSVGNVFRYKIFDASGRLRLVSDELTALGDTQNLSEHNAAAAGVLARGKPHVVAKEGAPPRRPLFFAEAYVPVISGGRTIAIVEAYVDQTEKRQQFGSTLTLAALMMSALTLLAFGGPVIAWSRRTREKQRADERIRFLAHHDAMTGLPNRARFMECLQEALAACAERGPGAALHYIDLDRFKDINDTLGHDAGDALIVAAADRLRAIARPQDIVARIGGDEFALLQLQIEAAADAVILAQRVVVTMGKPFHLNGHESVVTASVGVAMAPEDGRDATRLMKCADLALHKSKAEGRNCVRAFASEMDAELQARLMLERAIREAALHERFELHYQPLLRMADEQLTGFEALLRLPGDDGFISPAVFIPVAEEMGLIGRIGAWVLREACRTAAMWPEGLTISVNLSPAQFATGSVYDAVKSALSESGLAAPRLELEITESLLLDNTESVLTELHRLKALGVAIAMDDFGTGYSSLSYLWRFPFDKIKIDRAFMTAFDAADENVETIIRTIVALGRSLKMEITVEGVENGRQVEFLRDVRCDQVQGFYFGRPMPGIEVAARILADLDGLSKRSRAIGMSVMSIAHTGGLGKAEHGMLARNIDCCPRKSDQARDG
jgi:diguanylate cyclase (GGDEF)-like protein